MSDEKKILIDDDWKSQVAAEKEALKARSLKLLKQPAAADPADAANAAGVVRDACYHAGDRSDGCPRPIPQSGYARTFAQPRPRQLRHRHAVNARGKNQGKSHPGRRDDDDRAAAPVANDVCASTATDAAGYAERLDGTAFSFTQRHRGKLRGKKLCVSA